MKLCEIFLGYLQGSLLIKIRTHMEEVKSEIS